MVKNLAELARSPVREKALAILNAGYEAINIRRLVKRKVSLDGSRFRVGEREFDLKEYNRIFLVAFGKGAAEFAGAVAEALGDKLEMGIALDITKPEEGLFEVLPEKMEFLVGTHPLPSAANIAAAKKIAEMADRLGKRDLLLTLVTGGGSSLLTASEREFTDALLATTTLTRSGAPIDELNTVRKHLGDLKGGGLARLAYPATVVALIACDVCCRADIDLSMVASGPTVMDKTTRGEAEEILTRYGLNPYSFNLRETPKDEMYFERVENILIACNQDALSAMEEKAREAGFKTRIISTAVAGQARDVFREMLDKVESGEALLAGGETTVKIKGRGRGGRNQEAVLGGLRYVYGHKDWPDGAWAMASVASDGRDNTEAAGAIGDELTLAAARKQGLDMVNFLDNNDSFSFFSGTGDLIYADRESFNVADLMLVIRER